MGKKVRFHSTTQHSLLKILLRQGFLWLNKWLLNLIEVASTRSFLEFNKVNWTGELGWDPKHVAAPDC